MRDYAMFYSILLSDIGVYDREPFMASDMELKSIHTLALKSAILKKLQPSDEISKDALRASLEKFERINSSIPENYSYPGTSEVDSLLWDYFRDNLAKVLDYDISDDANFDLDFIRRHFAGGPGASLGCDNESFYTKFFGSRISMTDPYLLALYRAAIAESDTWSEAEFQRQNEFGHEIVEGNRLFFVPKTTEIARTCCTEPFLNMLFQKALGAFIERRLERHFGISLSTQPDNNRELARIGSLDGTFGTIDCVSASDSIGWSLCTQIIPNNLLGYFRLSRCSQTIMPDGSVKPLNMISTMGNGFTFPLQTVIFACAVRAVYQLKGLTSSCPRTEFGVFGDDIVVRREAYDCVISFLNKLGFEVNVDKSFNTGSFRESCGHDFYNGHFVRGVYVRSLESHSDVYSTINRLVKWSAISGVRLPRTIKWLRGCVRDLPVPFSESDDCGIKTPFKFTYPKVTDEYWYAYRKRINIPRRRKVPEDSTEAQQLGYKSFNSYGWAVAFLGGYARRADGFFIDQAIPGLDVREWSSPPAWLTLREESRGARRTKVVRESIPYWDWRGPVELAFYSVASWQESYAANLTV